MAYEIEKDIPVPPHIWGKGTGLKNLLCQMKVGDSVFLAKSSGYVSGTVHNAQKASGFRFCRRQVEGGYRVWRVA